MIAKCHGCKQTTNCEFCNLCKHWFGDCCRNKWLNRTGEFFKQLMNGTTKECCGPDQVEFNSDYLKFLFG